MKFLGIFENPGEPERKSSIHAFFKRKILFKQPMKIPKKNSKKTRSKKISMKKNR
jgi:hypothetical protein